MSTEITTPAGDRTVYAVWIRGKGWLKQNEENAQTAFASFEFQVAETAAHLWGSGAQVLPFDGSLLDLEPKFLERERERTLEYRLRAWLRNAVSPLAHAWAVARQNNQHGILG